MVPLIYFHEVEVRGRHGGRSAAWGSCTGFTLGGELSDRNLFTAAVSGIVPVTSNITMRQARLGARCGSFGPRERLAMDPNI